MNPLIGFIFIPLGIVFVLFGVKVSELKKNETLLGFNSNSLKSERGTFTIKPIIIGLFLFVVGLYFVLKYFGIKLD